MAEAGTLLLALAFIVAGAGVARFVFARLRLPSVAGEILFGVAMGPSLLGWAAPGLHGSLFGSANADVLAGMAWIGLTLFVLQIGLETHWPQHAASAAVRTAAGGLVLPLAAGMGLALAAPAWFFDGVSFKGILLVGIALTVSALPVLARILEDLGLQGHRLGAVAIAAATLDDVVGWVLLGLVAVAGSTAATTGFALGVALALGVGLAAIAGDRALGGRLDALRTPSRPLFVAVLALVFGAAAFTDWVGLSAALGPLGVGLLLARHTVVRDDLRQRLGHVTRILLLPIFFVASGAAVDLRLLPLPSSLVALGVVLAVASLSKVLGCAVGGRAAGMGWRSSLGLGCLLNARGAVGLVVLTVGHEAGLLSTHGYSLLVLVVALTTAAAPLLSRWTLGPGMGRDDVPPGKPI